MILRKFSSISLSSLVSAIVLCTSLLLVATLMLNVKHESDTAALETAEVLFGEIASKTIAKINIIVESISKLTQTASLAFKGVDKSAGAKELSRDTHLMKLLLDENPDLMSVYVGYNDGAFHQVFAPRGNSSILKAYDAPSGAAYIDRVISSSKDGGRRQLWRFLDSELNVLSARTDDAVEYDPRNRPWYLDAMKRGSSVYTEPYVFSSSKMPGITCAHVLDDNSGVFGVDLSLAQLADILAAQKVSKSGSLWIVDAANQVIAYPGQKFEESLGESKRLPLAGESRDPLVRGVAQAASGRDPDSLAKPFYLNIGDQTYLSTLTPMPKERGLKLYVAVVAPLEDITGYISRMVLRIVLLSVGILLLVIPLTILLARRLVQPVTMLAAEAIKIQQFDFSPSSAVNSSIGEVQSLARATNVMKQTIQAKTESLISTQNKLELLVEGGLALSAEKDMARLVTLIFQTAKDIAKADGGVMYLYEGEELGVELLALQAKSLILGGLSDKPAPRVKIRPEIIDFLAPDSVLYYACEAFNDKRIVTVRDTALSLFPTGLPEEPDDYRINSLIAVPIVTRRDEILGVIQLFNVDLEDGLGTASAENNTVTDFIGSLAAQAAVTLDNRNLVKSLRELFDALIQVIASSIDSKSPYTAGHCTRVPVLTELLAKAAHDTDEGPMRDFHLDSEDQWRQLWIAAWLHDCCKVTTPEYVVDKATKLETIYDRIHEVRMRFEVLRRDAEIEFLVKSAQGNEPLSELENAFAEELKQLDDDFAFVAKCNTGGEFFSDEDKKRLKQIASRGWKRYYSDRLGLSEEELRRKGQTPEPELPADEQLLADKPEHIIPRHKYYPDVLDSRGNPLSVPENEYNRGELYNLMISRGTLTPEERFKINEHTLSGMEMLMKIPFPEQLQRVTEIATAHHETLIGTGYPMKMTLEQIPIEARILAIADIFEALTASDRPYKKAKTLSETLKIMSFMRNDKHIDPDIFDIFLKNGIFKVYAEKHLLAEQNDVEDISLYLTKKSG